MYKMKALIVIIKENKNLVQKTNVIKVLQNKWISKGKNGHIFSWRKNISTGKMLYSGIVGVALYM